MEPPKHRRRNPPREVSLVPPYVFADARERLLREVPSLGNDAAALALLGYALLAPDLDEDTGRVLVDLGAMAAVQGVRPRDARGEEFLGHVKAEHLPGLSWEEHTPATKTSAGRSRQLVGTGLPNDLIADLQRSRSHPLTTPELVHLVTGRPVASSARSLREARQRQREADLLAAQTPPLFAEQGRLLRYLNGLSPHAFSKTVGRALGAAFEAADRLDAEGKRTVAYRELRRIELQPQPLYAPSQRGKTSRVFANGIPLLPGSVRRALTPQWIDFDLKSAQLAVAAGLWDVPKVSAFLDSGGSIWSEISGHLGLPTDPVPAAVKKPIKEFVYAAMYGKARRALSRTLTTALSRYTKRAGPRLMKHPVIEDLLRGRDEELGRLLREGRAVDVFGRELLVADQEEARSVAAQLAQAVELAILLPVIEIAEASDDFDVVLWQHDGFSVAVRDKSKEARIIKRIEASVSETAAALGVPTRLVRAS